MEAEKNLMKQEAINRLKKLIDQVGLNPVVVEEFKDGRLFYSYLTADGLLGSVDTIHYDERYAKVVEEFEERTGALVYHAIESFSMLELLFVSKNTRNWEYEQFDSGWIDSYVYNFAYPGYSEWGQIKLTSYLGALMRIG